MADPGVSRETQMPVITPSMFPGFRFSPTDVELISYYLKKKLEGSEKSVAIIPEIEICRHEPWDLPGKSFIKSENEWFFFSARGRKYPNGSQSKRATEQGYWKATGKERNVKSGSNVIGTKRTLVFHIGRAPKGERTEWIMHEYCMEGKSQDLVVCRLRKNIEFRSSSSRAPLSQGHSNVNDENRMASEGGIDKTDPSERDKAFELSERHTSSYDSHSIENIDSASESEQKLSNEITFPGPSTPRKESDEEDWFSEILKDDIIKLNETSLSTSERVPIVANKYEPVPVVATRYEPERIHWQPVETGAILLQGTMAQQIVKVYPTVESRHVRGELSDEKNKSKNTEQAPLSETKSFLSQFSAKRCILHIFSVRTIDLWHISIIFFYLGLLVLFLGLVGGQKPSKMFPGLFATRSSGA